MKASEILGSLPNWANATASEIVHSSAWAMPCRLGDAVCAMRHSEFDLADTLDVSILLEELHRLWPMRAEVPEPILLALVEKDCGPFLQLLENAARRQLKVVGLAGGADEGGLSLRVCREGDDVIAFAITASTKLVNALGKLAFIDTSDASVRDETVQAVCELASFTLPQEELDSLAPGDMLLLPEIGSVPPRLIVCERFLVDENGVSRQADDGRLHVQGAEATPMTLGELFDHAASPAPAAVSAPRGLRLVFGDKTVACGRLDSLCGQNAFAVESLAAM